MGLVQGEHFCQRRSKRDMSFHNLADEFIPMVRDLFSTTDFIPLHAPSFSGMEKEYVLETIESTFVSSVGEFVDQFEADLTAFTGARFAIATSSGTAALHTALHLVGVQQGDEVITSPLTFVATCNAIRYCNAEPVFVDIEENTLGLCPISLAEFLDRNTEMRNDGQCWNLITDRIVRACLPVHNLGHPARVREIVDICTEHNIEIVEDAAESLGSYREGTHTGCFGKVGTLSFNGNKIITTGGGGALVTNDKRLALPAKHITTTAKRSHPWLFQHDQVGFNYRLPNLNAALGCAQIRQLSGFISAKRSLAEHYREWFGKRSGVEFVTEPNDCQSNYWLNSFLLPDRNSRDEFLRQTNNAGVMTRPIWTPMHTLPMYQGSQKANLDKAENIEERLVEIPSSVVRL